MLEGIIIPARAVLRTADWRAFGRPGRWNADSPGATDNLYLAAWLADTAYLGSADKCTFCWSDTPDKNWEARMRNVLEGHGAVYSK